MTSDLTQIPQLPQRKPDTHKGDFGRVLIVGGSREMVGAAALAGLAALRSGAGLVRIAVPQCVQSVAAQLVPCATTIGLPENGPDATSRILRACADNDSVVVGPGMGRGRHLKAILETLVDQCDAPLLIDADGLNALAGLGQTFLPLKANCLLTPHPGEMKRLWNAWFREPLPGKRRIQAETLARRSQAVVVLKGCVTVVTDGKQTYINDTGNPGLATGGSGDVLSGTIGALLALGGKEKFFCPLDAAILGVWAHGKAADVVVEQFGQVGLIASDLPEAIGKILSDS
jgi:hydroxyethylthiazole kinase-like uncharacterized protein yjeF